MSLTYVIPDIHRRYDLLDRSYLDTLALRTGRW